MSRPDQLRLAGLAGAVAALHAAGWGLYALSARGNPALAGVGVLAYTLGLRHALDADHLAAIDNSTRKLLRDGGRPLATGFFFSLGHSTVVLALAGGLAVATTSVGAALPTLQGVGGTVGAGVSGVFLWTIGLLNLIVLLDVLRIARRRGEQGDEALEGRLLQRGFASRFLLGRLGGRIRASWHLYPVGLLFGLGFDTASEVGLLVLAGGAASRHLPLAAVLSLPLLFAAGMSLLDTADGALMSRAYGWALARRGRRIAYDVALTGLSVAAAFTLGTIELLRVWAP